MYVEKSTHEVGRLSHLYKKSGMFLMETFRFF